MHLSFHGGKTSLPAAKCCVWQLVVQGTFNCTGLISCYSIFVITDCVFFKAYNLEREKQQAWQSPAGKVWLDKHIFRGGLSLHLRQAVTFGIRNNRLFQQLHSGQVLRGHKANTDRLRISSSPHTDHLYGGCHESAQWSLLTTARNVQQQRTILRQHTQTELKELDEPHMHRLAQQVL